MGLRPHPRRRRDRSHRVSLPRDLLAQAKLLATKEKSRPKQASLRRSVSAAYYALFHLLVDAAARRLVSGADRQPLRNCLVRAFDHGVMKRVALQFAEQSLSPRLSPALNGLPLQDEIVRVAAAFVDLQQHRHDADYNLGRRFTRVEVLNIVSDAEQAFVDWRAVRNSAQADTFVVGLLTYEKIRL